jgi:lactate dehydrogenase-like 2-hydroxyacid dehydrogenase
LTNEDDDEEIDLTSNVIPAADVVANITMLARDADVICVPWPLTSSTNGLSSYRQSNQSGQFVGSSSQ